uniref:Major facilitator superfamily (MFS) profile domain-containing protein n=1 Tax=Phaeomonas parva TaxID=124430 RepID=A0A7S1TWM2_9STRA
MAATLLAYLPKPFAVLAASSLMDTVGRRGLLLYNLPIMGACLALLSCTFTLMPANSIWRAVAAVLGTSFFSIAFSFSLGPIPNIISSELLPSDARSLGMSLSVGVQWLFSAMLVYVFPILTHKFGTQTMIAFFASMCVLAWFFTKAFVPETAGKSLEESSAMASD